jgi:threonylcarbamoyladenosine tRNA methylthiotransferase MtaB
VQTGCDHRCTFCIIPYGRGNSRSVGPGEVVAQVRRLVEAGCPEVVLSGVDITSYGKDLPGHPSLGNLVRRILKMVPDLQRLRISSIDSVEADEDLMIALAEEERLMPHLHLSLQAGDDMILKRMKRRHSRADAVAFCDRARQLRPDVVFGADIIAGFPTETEAMFANSLGLVDDCGLTFLHVFPYSKRPGTPAARMPQVDGAAIKQRAKRLREAGQERLRSFMRQQVGRCEPVLFETPDRGRTRHYVPVSVALGAAEPGQIRPVKFDRVNGESLVGELVA